MRDSSRTTGAPISMQAKKKKKNELKWIVVVHSFRIVAPLPLFWYVLFYILFQFLLQTKRTRQKERERTQQAAAAAAAEKSNKFIVAFLRFSFYFCHFYVFRFGLSFRCSLFGRYFCCCSCVSSLLFFFFSFDSLLPLLLLFYSVRIYASSFVFASFCEQRTHGQPRHTARAIQTAETIICNNNTETVAERLVFFFFFSFPAFSCRRRRRRRRRCCCRCRFEFGAARTNILFIIT